MSSDQPEAPPSPARTVMRALDDHSVRWALARPVSSLERVDGDIDVLVHADDLREAERLARQVGFTAVPSGWPGDVVLVARVADRLEWLHLQPAIRIGTESVGASSLLERAGRIDDVAVIHDDDLLAVLLLHDVIDRDGVPERHRDDVRRLASSATSATPPWADALAYRHGFRYPELSEAARAEEWNRIAWRAGLVRPLPSRRDRISGRVERVRRRWSRRGLAIAVLGPDGAGKSTLVTRLVEDLPGSTTAMYMGLTGGRMPVVERMRIPGLVLAGRVALLWVRWGVAASARWRGTTVVFDRYVVDGLVPPGDRTGGGGRWSRAVLARACPAPDLAVVLDAPGSVLHRRSGEYDAVTLEAWRQRYLDVAASRRWMQVLDATRPADEVADDAINLAWVTLSERWDAAARRRRRV